MSRSLVKGLVCFGAVLSAVLLGGTNIALGQSRFGPALEGVSYSDMAEWQSRYGGGFYGGACGPAFAAPQYMGQFCPPEPPVPCKVRKRMIRKRQR